MKLMCKALICGLAIAAASAVGCSGQSTGTSGSTGKSTTAGEIGLKLTLQGGQTINSLNYVLSNGTAADGLTGIIPLPTGAAGAGPFTVPTFEIVPVVAASGYTITLSGTSTDGSVTCSGSSAPPFAVTVGNETVVPVLVTCTATVTTGSVEVVPTIQNCPTIGNLTAINGTATTTAPGNTSTIFGAAVGPTPSALTYTFSVLSGTGTLGTTTVASGNASASVVFTCPAVAENDTIQLVTSDQAGAVCPTSLSTATVVVKCGNLVNCSTPTLIGTGVEAVPDTAAGTCGTGQQNTGTLKDSNGDFCCSAIPCFGVGTGVEATPDTAAGTCPSGSFNTATDSAGNFCCAPPAALGPCTTAAAAAAPTTAANNCVTCSGNTSGVCSPTEAAFVARDIKLGLVTTAGNTDTNKTADCYACLVNGSCLDDSHGDTGNECEDSTGAAAYAPITAQASNTTVAECEAVVSCILGSSTGTTASAEESSECAANSVGTCYCGTAANSTCASGSFSSPAPGPINGTCASQIAAGLGLPLGDGADIAPNFNATTTAGGRANQIFTCANSNACNACL